MCDLENSYDMIMISVLVFHWQCLLGDRKASGL